MENTAEMLQTLLVFKQKTTQCLWMQIKTTIIFLLSVFIHFRCSSQQKVVFLLFKMFVWETYKSVKTIYDPKRKNHVLVDTWHFVALSVQKVEQKTASVYSVQKSLNIIWALLLIHLQKLVWSKMFSLSSVKLIYVSPYVLQYCTGTHFLFVLKSKT